MDAEVGGKVRCMEEVDVGEKESELLEDEISVCLRLFLPSG